MLKVHLGMNSRHASVGISQLRWLQHLVRMHAVVGFWLGTNTNVDSVLEARGKKRTKGLLLLALLLFFLLGEDFGLLDRLSEHVFMNDGRYQRVEAHEDAVQPRATQTPAVSAIIARCLGTCCRVFAVAVAIAIAIVQSQHVANRCERLGHGKVSAIDYRPRLLLQETQLEGVVRIASSGLHRLRKGTTTTATTIIIASSSAAIAIAIAGGSGMSDGKVGTRGATFLLKAVHEAEDAS